MKIFRSVRGVTDMMDVDTSAEDGELTVTIVNGVGNNPVSATFAVRKDIAQVLIKTLFDGMRLENPDESLPVYKIEP